MSGFSSEWLDLREPIDHAARSEAVISALCHYFLNDWKLIITDLGSGTGSTVRALKPVLSKELTWHLLDNDEVLLAEAKTHAKTDHVICSDTDLSASLDKLFSPEPDLITTSAFLDLVSYEWLETLVREITSRNIPFYAALTYDGRAECHPTHASDERVLNAFNQHQKTDKGFGPALGPDAADTAIRLFQEAGYIVCDETSDWRAGPQNPVFETMLLEGWKNAASELFPQHQATFEDWFEDRKHSIRHQKLSVMVGHKDFFAVPKD